MGRAGALAVAGGAAVASVRFAGATRGGSAAGSVDLVVGAKVRCLRPEGTGAAPSRLLALPAARRSRMLCRGLSISSFDAPGTAAGLSAGGTGEVAMLGEAGPGGGKTGSGGRMSARVSDGAMSGVIGGKVGSARAAGAEGGVAGRPRSHAASPPPSDGAAGGAGGGEAAGDAGEISAAGLAAGIATGSRSRSASSCSSDWLRPAAGGGGAAAPATPGAAGGLAAAAGPGGGTGALGSSAMIFRMDARISSIVGSPDFSLVCMIVSVPHHCPTNQRFRQN
jgi:hypothetical protein